jgi:hypothetical protein
MIDGFFAGGGAVHSVWGTERNLILSPDKEVPAPPVPVERLRIVPVSYSE